MRILLATSEVVPFAKTGGLADVAGALPGFLETENVDVVVIMPLYGQVNKGKFKIKSTGKKFQIKIGSHYWSGEFYEADLTKKSKIYFVKNDKLYDRDGLYVGEDG